MKSAYYQSKKKAYQLYIIEIIDKDICKIGLTNALQFRLYNLKQGIFYKHRVHAFKLNISDKKTAQAIEKDLLEHFGHQRIRSEWFTINHEEIVQYIKNGFSDLISENMTLIDTGRSYTSLPELTVEM
jgi:hypothetical protein